MTIDLILFLVLSVIAVASAGAMLLNKNAIYSALFLIVNFVTIAVFYLLLGAPFLSMAQVTVYAGAIMVLFLFVIMLLGTENTPDDVSLSWQRPLATVLAVLLIVEIGYLLFFRSGEVRQLGAMLSNFGGPREVGLELFTRFLLPFEVTSVLLLVAMVGVIVLTLKDKKLR